MGRNSIFSKDKKIEIIKRYKNGESLTNLSSICGLSSYSIMTWVYKYDGLGEDFFNDKQGNKSYSKQLKERAIKDYLNGDGSYEQIAIRHRINSKSILINWVKKYNSHIEITDYDPKPEVYMAKSRKTTYKERIEIVNYCLDHNKNYKDAAFEFGVNYAQVYSWVKKYKEQGEDGLKDTRGRKKTESEMNVEEKLRYELKKSEAKRKYLEMELEALKKLEEIERREIVEKSKRRSTKRYLN